ncbi:HEAT repeat-containing protein 1 [Agrilus planipennis]|uniref:HEAT repeat-containing protein 1 n=1 Tax=Agrilus planipennis TaxID=224129 RepID=A0A1W4WPB8_AGRPL|nr:HEAT repeat-containing protein 1 [Agrilus planipennis]
MSTSLAEQLQRLAVPQTSAIIRGKKRASLLFDPSEAANLNRETVYQIGIDGFEELKNKNAAFVQFESTLFHPASKDFERSVQNADTNKRLDKNIRKFLILLSPYFLLNSSHKALEWLIYRYHIHEYNKEDILMLILPYHETNIFVRVLQLLKLKESNDKWRWLRPLQKRGIHLTKQSLFNHAGSDPHFIKFLSDFVLTAVAVHEKPSSLITIFNFYCIVFTGAIEYTKILQETHISFMLPVLLKGISSQVSDFLAASLIILARLAAKTILSEKILTLIVRKLTKIEILRNEVVLTLVIIYQKQTHYKEVSMGALEHVIHKKWFPKTLQEFNDLGYNITPLLLPLLQASIREFLFNDDKEQCIVFVDSILSEIKMDEQLIKESIGIIFELCNSKFKYSEKIKDWIKKYVKTLERQYPYDYDNVIKELMTNSTKFSTKQHKGFRKIMKIAMEDSYDFFEKLYHPDPHTRIEAIKHLVNNNNLENREKNLIGSLIIDRLKDEDVGVVYETLQSFKDTLPDIIGVNNFRDIMFKLLIKCQKEKDVWWKISSIIFDVFSQHSNTSDLEALLVILPFLLPAESDEVKIAKEIVCSEYGRKLSFISPFIKEFSKAESYEMFSEITMKALGSWGASMDINTIIHALNEFPSEYRDALHKYIASLVISYTLQENTAPDISCLLIEIFQNYLNTSEIHVSKEKLKFTDHIMLARENNLSLEAFLFCIEQVISKTEKPAKKLGWVDFMENVEDNVFYLKLFKILLEGNGSNHKGISSTYKNTLNVFVNHICGNILLKTEFYLNVSVCYNEQIEEHFQVMCLKAIKGFLGKTTQQLNELITFDSLVVPYLMVALSKTNSEIRELTFRIIKLILEKTSRGNTSSFLQFLNHILTGEEEILMDSEQLPLIVYNIFSENNSQSLQEVLDVLFTISSSPLYPVYLSSGILKLLAFINDFNRFSKTSELAMEIFVGSNKRNYNFPESEIIYRNILRFDATVSEHVTLTSKPWQMITLLIRNDQTNIALGKTKNTSPAVLLLNQIDETIFEKLNSDVKKALLSSIIKLKTFSQNPEVLQSASRTFKRIHLDASIILDFLVKMKDTTSPKLNESKKKRRISIIPTVDILDTFEWKEGITVLEILQEKKKLTNYIHLLPVLFELLKKCLDFDEQSNVEYAKQLILSTILHLCSKSETEAEKMPENVFNMELVVQCIRASQNPQTHHHALLLLSYAASVVPDQVLHHIIAVFTFMGSSVLRHDDAYSFQIISKIIDTIVPLLIADNSQECIAKVLRVFVDAILDIPEHRRMPLFKQLLSRLDTKSSLYVLLLLIFEAHVLHGHSEKSKPKGNRLLTEAGNIQKRLDIAMHICGLFSPEILLSTCIKLLEYLRKQPDDKEEAMESDVESCTFDINRYSAKQFRHYKYTLVVFVSNLLSSREFVEKVASLPDDDLLKLEDLYKTAIVNILTYIQHTMKVAEKNVNSPQAQYWKVMLHHCYDILDSLNALLTPQMFLLVIRGLMEHTISVLRRRALELLNTKLQNNIEFFSECDESELQAVIPPLLNIIKLIEDDDKIEPDIELLIQTALLSLKLLVRLLAPKNPEKFLYILGFVTDLVKARKAQDNVLASIVLCLAELCANLRAHTISSLNKFMPALIKILKTQKTKEMPTLLLLSVLTALQKILDSLPLFLSPYLEKLLCAVSSLACSWNAETKNEKLTPFINKITSITHKIGTAIPSRVLIPAVESSYNNLINKSDYKAVQPLMNVFSENISQLKGIDLQAHIQELISFFLNSLQFRANVEINYSDANEVEGYLVKALITLILKLSESSFRPFYYKLYDWAVRTDAKTERVITFYHLSYEIANSLKGLFVLFAGHFLNNAANLLDACNVIKQKELYFENEEQNVLLVENILKTLNAVFLYDTQRFVNKERYDVLMQPIVDQLENTLGGVDSLEKRAQNLLSPCIVNFVVAVGDDALWKQVNYQIMLKTRHSDWKVRLAALDCLLQIVRKVGEDFLPLLPETIPFLAELLEDDEENVEKTCRRTVQEIEKIVGEPLQKYF